MMKQNLSLWQFAGFTLTSLGGTVLHFLYDLTNQNILVAPFSAVNESPWEHMKLIYFPLLVFALIQSRFFKEYKNFWCIKLVGILTGLILIPVLFYTCNGIFGKTPDWINISIFFLSTAVTFLWETQLFRKNSLPCKQSRLAFTVICLIGVLFVIFTFIPPKIPLFQNPLTNTYGIQNYN